MSDLLQAAEWIDGFWAFQKARGRMFALLFIPRPGAPIDAVTENLAEYWEPSDIRKMFRLALTENDCPEPVARGLIDLGKAGRLARLRQMCDAAGVRPVMLSRFAAPELADESGVPELWEWLFWCFTAPPEEIATAERARLARRRYAQCNNEPG